MLSVLKRGIYVLVAASLFFVSAMHFYPEQNQLKLSRCKQEEVKESERLMAIPFEKRLQMLGEGLREAAINETVIIVPINSGMARLMFNLRCSLKDLHVEPVLYFTYDLKVRYFPSLPHLSSLYSQPFFVCPTTTNIQHDQ